MNKPTGQFCKDISNKAVLALMNSHPDERAFLDKWHELVVAKRKIHAAGEMKRRNSDPEKFRTSMRASYSKHRAKRQSQAKLSREKRKSDPERLKKYRAWCCANVKNKKLTDPNFRIKFLMRNRIWMALQRGVSKAGPTVDLLGCTIPEFRNHIESLWLPGMTWENYGKHGWHIDHEVPCKKFNLAEPDQQKKCFHYSNTQPLWWRDNLSKGAKE